MPARTSVINQPVMPLQDADGLERVADQRAQGHAESERVDPSPRRDLDEPIVRIVQFAV